MRRQLLEISTVDELPDKLASTSVWQLQSVWLSLSLSTENVRLFVAWGKPENISRVNYLSKYNSSYIAWPLAGVLCKVDFPHCIAMHALLVKVRIEVNSFLFHVKSKHTVSSYCVQVSYQVP